jgi:hypothetical protein
MNIIDITSTKELPKDIEYYIFNDKKDLELLNPNAKIYRLVRKSPEEYIEYYVVDYTR